MVDDGKIYILGNNGNFVMNRYDRTKNNYFSEFKFFFYLRDQLNQEYGSFNTKIDGEEYIVSFDLIEGIKGIELGWRVVVLTPVKTITTGITRAGAQIFFIGLGVLAFGFIFSILIIRRYNIIVDKKYSEKHSVMMEQERLASLGQLIGGIAHNFKTPIMSISGGLEAINDLAAEYDNSIEDPSVTESDHHEIADEMRDWVKKIRPYCSYMSDIISAVKGQAVNCNESSQESFSVGDLIKRVEILMNHELKKFQCKMDIDLRVDESSEIEGEINNLVQVLNNLISNSIEAYHGEPGKIDLLFDKKDSNLEIVVRDYGAGIPDRVKNKLLKEMITTKGEKGTGIGLYMSYSTIKGKFAGTMHIESSEGKGTSITITIPVQKK
ncbi:MAG: Sporulation kinase A [Firmicutes bacterium ADurb.Bin419]|nr:MAG: Sporulation kinase A [Firmicutes bacterium ADurb.Bin419]